VAYVDLAAHLASLRETVAAQLVRDLADGADVRGHVLAFEAVAARCPLDEAAGLVAQRAGEPVDLRLGGKGERRVGGQAQEAADALDEIGDLACVNALLIDSIGAACRTFANFAAGAAPTRREGESGRTSAGKRASIASLRWRSESYSASEMTGASSW
jgi:hypothetical protein